MILNKPSNHSDLHAGADPHQASLRPAPLRPLWYWLTELVLMFLIIFAVDAALKPGFDLLSSSPHLFWLAVILFSAVYGTGRGIMTALTAAALLWWHDWPAISAMADFYTVMLALGKEPVLWLLTAIVLGAIRDKSAAAEADLTDRIDEARLQLEALTKHADALRTHVGTLETHIAMSSAVEIRQLWENLARLADCPTESLEKQLQSAIDCALGPRKFSVWQPGPNGWEPTISAPLMQSIPASLTAELRQKGKALKLDPAISGLEGGAHAVLAAPVFNRADKGLKAIILFGEADTEIPASAGTGMANLLAAMLGEHLEETAAPPLNQLPDLIMPKISGGQPMREFCAQPVPGPSKPPLWTPLRQMEAKPAAPDVIKLQINSDIKRVTE